jgi:hypothetical protein
MLESLMMSLTEIAPKPDIEPIFDYNVDPLSHGSVSLLFILSAMVCDRVKKDLKWKFNISRMLSQICRRSHQAQRFPHFPNKKGHQKSQKWKTALQENGFYFSPWTNSMGPVNFCNQNEMIFRR